MTLGFKNVCEMFCSKFDQHLRSHTPFSSECKSTENGSCPFLKSLICIWVKGLHCLCPQKNIFLSVTNLHGLKYFCKCSKYTDFVLKIYRFFWKNNIVTKRAFKRVKMYHTFCVINYRLKSVEQRNLLIINKYCNVNGDCLVTENSED